MENGVVAANHAKNGGGKQHNRIAKTS